MANPPGVNITVNAASGNPNTNAPTGTWFVTGLAAGGPSGVAVPVNSIQDFNTYFGVISNGALTGRNSTSATLYDSLDVYFREGGVRSYVSRVIGASSVKATCTIAGSSTGTWLTLTASGGGTWANSAAGSINGLQVVTASAGSGGYSLSVFYNGNQIGSTSPALFTAADAVNWVNSLSAPGALFTAVDGGGTGVPSSATYYFVSGTDVAAGESDWTIALTAFSNSLGAGQVSAPGRTTAVGWQSLSNHAIANNRVAILDSLSGSSNTIATLTSNSTGSQALQTGLTANSASTTVGSSPSALTTTSGVNLPVAAITNFPATGGNGTIAHNGVVYNMTFTGTTTGNLTGVQLTDGPGFTPTTGDAVTYTTAIADASYAAMFGPWIKVPGIASTQPNTIAPTFTRTVPPSGFVAGNIAAVDATNDANVPAAGVQNGACNYALDVVQSFSAADRASLNAAGVNLIRNINGNVAVYGFRSLALDANWTAFNNVRFRMQLVRDFDVLTEPFVFAEIDGKGQIFGRLAGVLSGQCQMYWLRNSLYGTYPTDAFTVNTGPQVNTPATIAAGQLNAQVNLRMSPQAEQVQVTVTKYLATATLPSY